MLASTKYTSERSMASTLQERDTAYPSPFQSYFFHVIQVRCSICFIRFRLGTQLFLIYSIRIENINMNYSIR